MKLSKTFLLFIAVIFIATVGIAVAEDVTVEPFKFTVPDGYTVVSSDDTTCAMQKDANNAISFASEVSDDLAAAKQTLIDQGKTFIEEKSIDYEGMNITLQEFSADFGGTTLYSYNYIMLSEDGNFVVTVATDDAAFDSDLNSDSNPAKVIFDTIEVSK